MLCSPKGKIWGYLLNFRLNIKANIIRFQRGNQPYHLHCRDARSPHCSQAFSAIPNPLSTYSFSSLKPEAMLGVSRLSLDSVAPCLADFPCCLALLCCQIGSGQRCLLNFSLLCTPSSVLPVPTKTSYKCSASSCFPTQMLFLVACAPVAKMALLLAAFIWFHMFHCQTILQL